MSAAPKPKAGLSLDLDNKWSYLMVHGDPGWQDLPSYFPILIPRFIELLQRLGLKATVFVVGLDAAQPETQPLLRSLVSAGHSIGNHSYKHESWMHRYSAEETAAELALAHRTIHSACGESATGFRGPGFSFSSRILTALAEAGYVYDASTFPTFIGPLARAYYFRSADLDQGRQTERSELYGNFSNGFRPNSPHRWCIDGRTLLEIPITTFPFFRLPIHLSYLLYLSGYSVRLARTYFELALAACRAARVDPSLLLHPLDLLGSDDGIGMEFSPAMQLLSGSKLEFVEWALGRLADRYEILALNDYAKQLGQEGLPIKDLREGVCR